MGKVKFEGRKETMPCSFCENGYVMGENVLAATEQGI